MKDLIMKYGHSIACFKKGDIITRLEYAVGKKTQFNENLGIDVETDHIMYGFVGTPLKLIGIFNNQIWFEYVTKTDRMIFDKKPLRLDVFSWSEGWASFELPEGYTLDDI